MKFVLYMLVLLVAVQVVFGQEKPDTVLTVKSILIEGNLTTKDFVILREMKLQPGGLATEEFRAHDENRIYSLGLFNKVYIDVRPEGNEAVVVVQVDERWYFFPYPVFGFRYRDFDKIFYGAGVIHQNFRGRNEKLFSQFVLGYDQWVQLSYSTPRLTADGDISLGTEAKYSSLHSLEVDEERYDQTNLKFGLTLGKRFGFYDIVQGWVNYDVWQISETGLGRTVSPDGRDAFVSAGLNYQLDTRDVREYPTNGQWIMLSAAKFGFGESPVNFFRYGFDARVYQRAFDDVIIAGRGFANFAGGGEVPKYQRAYFGFLDRLRGYFNDAFEGEHIAGGNIEFRIPLLSPRYYILPYDVLPQFKTLRYGIYFGVFADVGAVWFRGQDVFTQRWRSGYGAGLQFLLPYGAVLRTEFAWNMEGREQFVFDFGASF